MESVEAWRLTEDLHVEHGKADPFAAAIRATRMSMVIGDARRPDHPILFANDAFLKLTGYSRFEEEVLERTQELQRALEDGRTANRKLEAALQAQRLLTHEVDHRVRNSLQMISSLINMQERHIVDPAIRLSLSSMLERVETLSAVHRRLYQSGDLTRFDLAEFARELSTELLSAADRADIRLELDLEPVQIPAEQAAPIALMVNELIANALKHAFVKQRPGTIVVSLKRQGGHFCLSIADDGVGMTVACAAAGIASGNTSSKASFGRSLVESLSRQLRATTQWLQAVPGTRVEIRLPLLDAGAH